MASSFGFLILGNYSRKERAIDFCCNVYVCIETFSSNSIIAHDLDFTINYYSKDYFFIDEIFTIACHSAFHSVSLGRAICKFIVTTG